MKQLCDVWQLTNGRQSQSVLILRTSSHCAFEDTLSLHWPGSPMHTHSLSLFLHSELNLDRLNGQQVLAMYVKCY